MSFFRVHLTIHLSTAFQSLPTLQQSDLSQGSIQPLSSRLIPGSPMGPQTGANHPKETPL